MPRAARLPLRVPRASGDEPFLSARKARGREDQYIDAYFGREYPDADQPAREVIMRTHQILFHSLYGKERLGKLVRDAPELLDLALGVLFSYNPS